MPTKPETFETRRGAETARIRQRFDPMQSFYHTARWKRLKRIVLDRQPVCVVCQRNPSTDVDHIQGRATHIELEWVESNLQGLCKVCHTRKTNKEREHGG